MNTAELFKTIKIKILEKKMLQNYKDLDKIFIESDFFNNYADRFLIDILKEDFSEDQYDVIHAFSWFVFVELQGRNFGEPKAYDIPSQYEQIQEFIYDWDIFGSKRIPWNEWSDIAQEGMDVLKEIIKSNFNDYKKLPSRNRFMKKVNERLSKIIKNGKYDHEFQEWGKDS